MKKETDQTPRATRGRGRNGPLKKEDNDRWIDWIDQCTWSCPVCYLTTSKSIIFKDHIFSQHNLPIDNVRTQLLKKVMHKCKMCLLEILHSKVHMVEHYKCVHKIGCKEYYKQFILSDTVANEEDIAERRTQILCTKWAKGVMNKCTSCNRQFTSLTDLKKHQRNVKKHNYHKGYNSISNK